jgi:hypothetical protein
VASRQPGPGAWALQVEKAEYEAKRADRQFHAVEPENRVVARELERRWNDKLQELDAVRQKAESAWEKIAPLSEEEMTRARQLAKNIDEVWSSATTTNRDRKRLLRCLVDLLKDSCPTHLEFCLRTNRAGRHRPQV